MHSKIGMIDLDTQELGWWEKLLTILLVIAYILWILSFYVHRMCHKRIDFKALLP